MNIEEQPITKCFIKIWSYSTDGNANEIINNALKTNDFTQFCDYSKYVLEETKTQPVRTDSVVGLFKIKTVLKVKLAQDELTEFTNTVNEKFNKDDAEDFPKYQYYDLVTKRVSDLVGRPLLCTWYLDRYGTKPLDEVTFYVMDNIITSLGAADKLRQKRLNDKEFNGRMIDAVFKPSIDNILNKYGLEFARCHWKGDNEYYIKFKNENTVREFILSKLNETIGNEMRTLGIDIKWYKQWSRCGKDTTLAFSKDFKFNLKGEQNDKH